MKVGYIAARGRLVVKLIPVPDQVNGIFLTDEAKEKQAKRRATIEAVGSSELTAHGEHIPHIYRKGDVVVLSIYTQPEHLVDDYFAVRFGEVLAVETDPEGN